MSDGRKQVLAIRSGHRESTESWLKVLRDLRDRGLCAPVLLMADGGLPSGVPPSRSGPRRRCNGAGITRSSTCSTIWQARAGQGADALLTQIPVAETRKEAETRRERSRPVTESVILTVATLERDWLAHGHDYDFPEQTGSTNARPIRWRAPSLLTLGTNAEANELQLASRG